MDFSYRRIRSLLLPIIVCIMALMVLNSFYVTKAYPEEPDNREWYTGEKNRNGINLFIPGDVPSSPSLQKRTAEYKVQTLTMGVPADGKAYNPATLAVSIPNKEANAKRAIPVEKTMTRKMKSTEEAPIESTNTVTDSQSELQYIYITDRSKNVTSVYNVQTKQSEVISGVSSSTTQKYFGNLSTFKSDVTLTLQGTLVRFSYYKMFLRRWGGPISAVIKITSLDELQSTIDRIVESYFPGRIIFNLFVDLEDDYLINTMRNLAIQAVSTSHFFVADMDVWPTKTTYNHVIDILNPVSNEQYDNGDNAFLVGEVMNRENSALIVPVYEYTVACSSFKSCVKKSDPVIPANKEALRDCLGRKRCRQFREGQNLHNYYFDQWLYDNFTRPVVKVRCFVKDKQEPYLILRKSSNLPMFDERFKNYGYNKVQWVAHLRYTGYRFYVLGNDFAIDVAHPRSEHQKHFLSTLKNDHVTLNQNLYGSFLSGLLHHNRLNVIRICGRGGVEVDLNGSVDY